MSLLLTAGSGDRRIPQRKSATIANRERNTLKRLWENHSAARVGVHVRRQFGEFVSLLRWAQPDAGFTNLRRVRKKMQQLAAAHLVTERPFTIAGSGVMKFYQIRPAGYELLYQAKPAHSHRKFFRETAKLNWEHLYANAKVIVKSIVAAHDARVRVTHFCREDELRLTAGNYVLEPDHFFQLSSSGQTCNHLFEIDRNTEILDSVHAKSWRHRILGYEAYQDLPLANLHPSSAFNRTIATDRANPAPRGIHGDRSGAQPPTDDLGYKAVENPTYSYDLHAMALHMLGVGHTRLTFYHNGIERRLTDVHGHVIEELLA